MVLTEETIKCFKKNLVECHIFQNNPAETGLKLNPSLYSERPVTVSAKAQSPQKCWYLPTYLPTKYLASLHIRL
jgi:hypothetical protein